ncbi:DUF2238 domain-containing protein [Psychrobacter sp. I-STPA6b]|uniref:DUF2238 domain-containing protein n=1 Tax=Psychrobacter sp. I-STPA6b TaxID=2585718 RepID=UPI001D0C8744|nr:DUF2238 domain-containing protein [Psychrobacter sp. I-STPA6b]
MPPKPNPKPFNCTVYTSVIIVLLMMGLASINPLEWSSYLLHQAGTVIVLIGLLLAYRYLAVKTSSFVLACGFLLVHIIGARYLYSYVPYDDWLHAIFGIKLNDIMGWQRNMYDRLVHFCYGLLLFAVMRDITRSLFPSLNSKQCIAIVLMVNMSSSMLYELFEWGIAIGLSPEDAERYNGQQGDMWDAHKDMALALLGGIVGLCVSTVISMIKDNT